jgi:hypothetical protein
MPSDLKHLMRRLSLMPGSGTPGQWLESAGPVIEGILRQAGDISGAMVDRAMVEMQYRPTPFALTSLLRTMEAEEGDRVAERRLARSRSCACEGRGTRTIHVERWSGQRELRRVPSTIMAACVCPQGIRLSEAEITRGRWLTVPQWEERIRRRMVPPDGSRTGCSRYWVDDGYSAPPQWTRTDWMQRRTKEAG